jgi:hypothetical protein
VEAALSKVFVPLPKAPTMKAEQETDTNFEARIAKADNGLVGNYRSTEHQACMDQHFATVTSIVSLWWLA